MFCPNCGAALVPMGHYCLACGAAVRMAPPAPLPPPPPASVPLPVRHVDTPPPPPPASVPPRGTFAGEATLLTGDCELKVVGTSYYQPALRDAVERWRAANPRKGRIELTAVLVREPDNPHDPEAVAVYVDGGGKVGHLSREDARAYQPLLRRLAAKRRLAACEALVIGGHERGPAFGMRIWLPGPRTE